MKLIYCTHSTYNPGGMERVLLNKVTYLSRIPGWEVSIVTTDQHQRPPFYPFPPNVRMTDLGINYSDDNEKGAWKKITGYLRKRKVHKQKLTTLLQQEKADIVISLYPSESSFIPSIKDGSKKVLELHYCKFFRLQYNRKGILGWIDKWRTRQDERIVRRFDKFVVLTNEDREYWGKLPNMEVIPNAAMHVSEHYSDVTEKRVIAVGRLDYQKGFDRLIEAWQLIQHSKKFADWNLDIFGQGEWQEMLQQMIEEKGLQKSVRINKPTKQIGNEYIQSSMLVMSSNYEGFPMVLIEALTYGVVPIAFASFEALQDIIKDGINGFVITPFDKKKYADRLIWLMDNKEELMKMSHAGFSSSLYYSLESVGSKWLKLFKNIS